MLHFSGAASIFQVLGHFSLKLFRDIGHIGQIKINWAVTESCQNFLLPQNLCCLKEICR
jgi:hypothetical protein